MLQKSDLVLCTSSFLLQTRKQQNKNCVLFTHGVDVNKFKIAPPLDSKTVIFGYYGLVDERCDQGILVDLAQKCEQSEIHIWGKVTVPISQLTTHKNIIFHGEVPYHSLAKQISNVHCFILPYKVNEQTQTIYPLKIKEYLLTGRPIVTTHLPDMPSLLPHLAIANNPQEFLQHCQLIAKEKSFFRPQQVAFFEKTEDWGHKAKEFIQLLHTP